MPRDICKLLLVLIFSAFLVACAGYVTRADGVRLGLNSEAFRDYVETVFRLQNSVGDVLAFAIDDEEEPEQVWLEAEAKLLSACAGVNELALANRDGVQLSLLKQRGLALSVPECEAAALQGRELFPSQGLE